MTSLAGRPNWFFYIGSIIHQDAIIIFLPSIVLVIVGVWTSCKLLDVKSFYYKLHFIRRF